MEILVVSDLHGKTPGELESISKTFPGPVVFLGDIVGTSHLEELQRLFYNGVYNPIKKLLQDNPNPGFKETSLFPIGYGRVLYDGYLNLVEYLNKLNEFRAEPFTRFVHNITRYVHFGHFVSNLPLAIRQVLQKDMEDNAQQTINLMTNFTDRGQDVFVIEGNWDARTPLDFFSIAECKAIPVNQRSFYFKSFLLKKNPKVHYFDKVGTAKFKDNVFVFWPFDCATTHTPVPEIYHEDVKGKVVLFSHGQADWQSIKGNTPMTAEGAKVQEVMTQVISDLKPDLIVHGHLHDDKPDYLYDGIIPVIYCPLRSVRTLII